MHPLSPALVIAGASTLVGAPRFRKDVLDPVSAAAFIGHVGYWAHYDESAQLSAWPFPLDADCEALKELASELAVVSVSQPDPGAIYLGKTDGQEGITRAGIIVDPGPRRDPLEKAWRYDCLMLEGSAVVSRVEAEDARLSVHVLVETTVQWARRTRVRCIPSRGDVFISWVDLDTRNEMTRVASPRAA